jgi:hypothetical protein
LIQRAVNSNMPGSGDRRPATRGSSNGSVWFDDGALARWVFRLMLVIAAGVLALDFQAIRSHAPSLPEENSSGVAPLPPALSDGEPPAPPAEITTDAELLRQPVRFSLQPGGTLLARGAFDPGSAERFAAEIAARGEYVERVALDSPGGSVEDAIAIGRLIREKGFATHVAEGALCASSCPLAMAGGTERTAEPDAVIGVHQIYGASAAGLGAAEAMSSAQETTARIVRYLGEMGIAQGLWLRALETPPDRLHYLTAEDLAEVDLVSAATEETAQR